MRFYRGLVTDFWREQPGEKARLSAQAAGMLWDPTVSVEREERSRGSSGSRRTGASRSTSSRSSCSASPASSSSRAAFAVLAVALLAYNTLAAMVFVGNAATACRGTSCSRCSPAVALERLWLRLRTR